MNVIKLTMVACLAALWAACAGNSDEYVLTGKLKNCQSSFGVIRVSEAYSDEIKMDTVRIAADGTFRYSCKLERPRISFLMVGEQSFFNLILINGTTNTLEADLSIPGDCQMGGDLETAYSFYKNQQSKLTQLSEKTYSSFQELQETFFNFQDSIRQELSAIPNQEFCRLSFQELESMVFLYQITYYDRLREQNLPANADADYNRYMLENKQIAAPENLSNGLLFYYLGWCGQYRVASGGNDPFQYQIAVACDKIKDPVLQNKTLLSILGDFFGSKDSYHEVENIYTQAKAMLSDSLQQAWLTEKYTIFQKLRPGAPAIDCEWIDVQGRSSRLSDLFGKVLYIDVWATWCGPCCAEIPYLEKLAAHYKNDARLEIVSVSVDADHQAWKNKLAKDKPQWKQFLLEDFTKLYNINGIPRFLLIDRTGKIITVDAPRPSDPEIIPWLEEKMK